MSHRILVVLALLLVIVAGSCSASAKALTQVSASEIISRIAESQPVYYEGVTIVGDLNLCALPDARAKGVLSLINCSIANASFNGLTLEKDVILLGTTFGNVSFTGAVFQQPVVFDGAKFQGSASFEDSQFDKDSSFNGVDFRDVDFNYSQFKGYCLFSGARLLGNASFKGAVFQQPVVFEGAKFQGSASFEDSQFDKDSSFNGVDFRDVDFNYSQFKGYCLFSGASFLGNARFMDVAFLGTADFSSAKFSQEANFIRSRFDEGASFSDAFFGGLAKFGLSRFQGLCSFGDVTFAREANFGLARFSDAAYFSGAQFQDIAIFGLTKFEDIASFQGASFADDLILKGALISTFLLENGDYGRNARIILNDSNIDRLKVHWSEIGGHLVWNPGAYLALVNNYRNLGWSSDEDDCYYQYRNLNQEHKSLGWSKAIDALAHLSCGYGVRPSYAVVWSLLTILIFALVFWLGDGIRRSAQPLQGPAEPYSLPEHVTFRNALFFSTMIFLSQGPIDFLPVGRHRYYVILEGILGWLLLALFLVTLGKVMIR